MKRGFSLVELSIVLVILGLLTGGILAGQSLIKASQLKKFTADTARYRTAFYTFRDKYFALPGDMSNATKFWGTAASCPGDYTTPSSTAATCDGDGDGKIEYFSVATSHEHMRAWQQLANAGLIEGTYSGVPATTEERDCDLRVNCPGGQMGQTAFLITSYGPVTTTNNPNWFIGDYDNIMQIGRDLPNAAVGGAMGPVDAWNIDTKLDDGKPSQGFMKVQSYNNSPICTTSTDEATSTYNVGFTGANIPCTFFVKVLN